MELSVTLATFVVCYLLFPLSICIFWKVPGTGFHTRDPTSQDIEDEVDIDGDDQDKYGEVQFTESDILPVDANSRSLEAEEGVLDGDQSERGGSAQQSLRDLIAEGKNIRRQGRHPNDINVGMFRTGEVEKLDLAIAKAKQKGVLKAIVVALEDKIKYLVISFAYPCTSKTEAII